VNVPEKTVFFDYGWTPVLLSLLTCLEQFFLASSPVEFAFVNVLH